MSSYHVTDSYNVDLMNPNVYYDRIVTYPEVNTALLSNIKAALTGIKAYSYDFGKYDEDLIDIVFGDIDEIKTESLLKIYRNYKKEFSKKITKKTKIKKNDMDDLVSYENTINTLSIPFMMNYTYSYWNGLEEMKDIDISELPYYLALFLRINYAFHINKIIHEILLEKSTNPTTGIKKRTRKKKIDYDEIKKDIDDTMHYSNDDIKYKVNNTERYSLRVCMHRLKKMLASNMEILVYIDKMKKDNGLVESLKTKDVYKYFNEKNKMKYEYFEIDEPYIKIEYKKYSKKNHADICRELLNDMKDLISEPDAKHMFSMKNLLFMSFDKMVLSFKNRLIHYSGNSEMNVDEWYKKGCPNNHKLKEYQISLIKKMKYYCPTETSNNNSIEECTILYCCLIRINYIYEIMNNIALRVDKTDKLKEFRYNLHLVLMDHMPLISYIMSSLKFKDSDIMERDRGAYYYIVRPIEGRAMHAGNLPDIKPLIYNMNFVSLPKTDGESPISNIILKCLPFCCKIRMINSIASKYYQSDSETRNFIDASIECTLFGLYPTSNQNLFTDFTSLLKLYSYMYTGNTELKRKKLFEKINKNQIVLQNIIRECFIYCIGRMDAIKDFIINKLWSGKPYIQWSEFEHSVINNTDLLRKYFNLTKKLPGFWDNKTDKKKPYDEEFAKFLEDEYKLNNSDIPTKKKKIMKAWISPDVYRIFPNNWIESIRNYLNDLFIEKYVLNTVKTTNIDVINMLDLPDESITKKIDEYEHLGKLSKDYVNNFGLIFSWLHRECGISIKVIDILCNTISYYIKKKSPSSIKSELRILCKDYTNDYKILKYYIMMDQQMDFVKTVSINESESIKTLISMQKRNRFYINPCIMDVDQYVDAREEISREFNDMDYFKVRSTKCCNRVTNFAFGLGNGNYRIVSNADQSLLFDPDAKPFADDYLKCCSYSKKTEKDDDVLDSIINYDYSKDIDIIKSLRKNVNTEKKLLKENKMLSESQRIINKQNMIIPFDAKNLIDIELANKTKRQKPKRKLADPLKSLGVDNTLKKKIKKQARKIMRNKKINLCKMDDKNGILTINAFNKLLIANTRKNESISYRFCPECGGFCRYYHDLVIGGEYMCDRCTTLHPRRNVFAYCNYYKKVQLINKQKMEQIIQSGFSENLMNTTNDKNKEGSSILKSSEKVSLNNRSYSRIVTSEKNKKKFSDTFIKYYDVCDKDGIIKNMKISNRLGKSNLYLRQSKINQHKNEMVYMKYIEQY